MKSLLPYHRFGLTIDGVFLGTAAFAWLAAAHAGPPKVGFDVSYSVECRDVTPQDFAEANPNSKIIEARFQVSALVRRGKEQDIKELMYVVLSPEKRLRVVDFEPKTQMESEFTDPVQVVETGEDASSVDGSLSVQLSPLAGVHVSPSAGASKKSKNNRQEKYSKLAPRQLLVASGTIHRGHGVFFKLRPFSQVSLQGRKEFVCRFVVPKDWRADYVYIDCAAEPRGRSPWTTSEDVGARRALVGLYAQGDGEAREAAERLAYAYEAYNRLGGSRAGAGAEPAKEVGSLFRRLPALSLFESVITDLEGDDKKTSEKKDDAWESFSAAREELARLAG